MCKVAINIRKKHGVNIVGVRDGRVIGNTMEPYGGKTLALSIWMRDKRKGEIEYYIQTGPFNKWVLYV